MLVARIYATDIEVDQRLSVFGVTRRELYPIIQTVVAARADATEDDPLSAGGQFAYIYGTRHVRLVFRPKKWVRLREENIEAVKHPTKDLKIIYQSVDIAASFRHDPRAISGKGSGADRFIDSSQIRRLFTDEYLAKLNPANVAAIGTGAWFFCVSDNEFGVRAELSLPAPLAGKNFGDFIERIFIVREGEWDALKPKVAPKTDDAVELKPIVTRK